MRLGDCRGWIGFSEHDANRGGRAAFVCSNALRTTRSTLFGITAQKIIRLAAILSVACIGDCSTAKAGSAAGFNFQRDTLAFANTTVFEYHNGEVVSRWSRKSDRYTRRCFVMTRTAEQFYKFARFEPNSPALDESEQIGRAHV